MLTMMRRGPPRLPCESIAERTWGNELDSNDAVSGLTDLSPSARPAWNRCVHDGMIYLTGNILVRSYDSQRFANIGIGFWVVDEGGGYTYFNQQTGRFFRGTMLSAGFRLRRT